MSILGKYTLRSLLKNKTRTFATILGIVLSVAMFTAVTEAIASMRSYLIKGIEYELGGFHALSQGIDVEQLKSLEQRENITQVETLGIVGYADIGSQNAYKPYLYITSMSPNLTSLVSIHLSSGRLPANSGEIILPLHLSSNGSVEYKIGDSFSVDIGRRVNGGDVLDQNDAYETDEKLETEITKTYTVVGFYSRFDTMIEPYSAPGYTAVTVGESTQTYDAFYKLKNAADTYDFINENISEYKNTKANTELLMLYGISRHATAMRVFFGMGAILVALIMFGSVALIYNSFSISVSERTRQFGILKSVGATGKQLRRTVYYEALYLCIVAVPLGIAAGCIGIWLTFYFLSGAFTSLGDIFGVGSGITLSLAISPAALAIAALIGVVTTFISAFIPAVRAVRVPALQAVTRANDISVKKVRIRMSPVIRRLFGFEGLVAAKNFKRNRRRYRAATFSLFVSVVLFISASSFCKYLTDSANTYDDTLDYDLSYSVYDDQNTQNTRAVYDALSSAQSITDSILYTRCNGLNYFMEWKYVSDRALSILYNGNPQSADDMGDLDRITPAFYFIDDDLYKRLAEENGIEIDINDPGAIVYDNYTMYQPNDDGDLVMYKLEYLNKQQIMSTNTLSVYEMQQIDGHSFYTVKNGMAYYIPDVRGNNEQLPVTEDDMLKIDIHQAFEKTDLKISGFLKENPYYVFDELAFIYPESAGGELMESGVSYMLFLSDDHSKSYDSMTRILDDMNADKAGLYDYAAQYERDRHLITIINVFAYGFIILISLIAMTNVFNTVSMNIFMRRRELAMFKSVGMTKKGFYKMMNYECIICGIRGLAIGIPAAVAVTFLIYGVITNGYITEFYIPWYSIAISVFSVFAVVFGAMIYSMSRLRRENTMDVLRNENN